MEPFELGPLRARKVVKPTGKMEEKPLTVVLMHGYGAPGDDLVGLASAIDAPPGTTFLFPEAPLSLSDLLLLPVMGDARAWWPIDIQRFERAMARGPGAIAELVKDVPEGLDVAREKISAMLDALANEAPRDRLVLGGFSQGSMLAIDAALRTDRALAGVVALSSTLVAADEWLPKMASRRGLPIFQSHGTEDPILPYAVAELLRRSFDEAGLEVDFVSFEGGHGIPPSVMRDLGAWLRHIPP
ncbi:MAG: dienelactone hydrolase family protein [Labilithrix sp.]|nr:dienelactone hydrolase family protein [Labilithrix sp.]